MAKIKFRSYTTNPINRSTQKTKQNKKERDGKMEKEERKKKKGRPMSKERKKQAKGREIRKSDNAGHAGE